MRESSASIGGHLRPSAVKKCRISFSQDKDFIWFRNAKIHLRFDGRMGLKVFYDDNGRLKSMNDTSRANPCHFIVADGKEVKNFILSRDSVQVEDITTEFGSGKRLTLSGIDRESLEPEIIQTLFVDLYEDFPQASILQAEYALGGAHPLKIDQVVNNFFLLHATSLNGARRPNEFWSFQGGAAMREHFVREITDDFDKENFQGVFGPGYGGGIPLVYLWQKEMGLAIGHIEPAYLIVSLPVKVRPDKKVEISLRYPANLQQKDPEISRGKSYKTIRCLLGAYKGDYYQPLADYSKFLQAVSQPMPLAPSTAYEAVWCSWGYHRDVTQEQILGMIPILKDMGIKWVVLDDGWFDVMGDWNTKEKTYPGGEEEIKNLVRTLHRNGFKVKLWTLPGVADGNIDIEKWEKEHPAMRTEIIKHPIHRLAKVVREHPHWFVKERGGEYAVSKRANYYFCPSLPEVQEYFRKLTEKFIRDWDFDGFKQDAVYICPPCYDKSHNHPYPEKAAEDYSKILEIIYQTTMKLKADAVVETCPCGVTPTFTWLFWQNQAVTADPVGSWQCRTRHKVMKALAGPVSAILSDHIEITDERDDFATQIGIGGVIATRFTPTGEDIPTRVEAGETVAKRFPSLDEEKRAKWKKWLGIYNGKMLAKGEYLNLYDVVYDVPETHCIRKDGRLYYAFYHTRPPQKEPQYEITSADQASARLRRDPVPFKGRLELRGLESKTYLLYDYVNDVSYGEVKGPQANIKIEFSRFLLLEATPQNV